MSSPDMSGPDMSGYVPAHGAAEGDPGNAVLGLRGSLIRSLIAPGLTALMVTTLGMAVPVAAQSDSELLTEVRGAILKYNAPEALSALDRLKAQTPAAEVLRAEAEAIDGKVDAAASRLEGVIAKAPTANALNALGEIRLLKENEAAAKQAFDRAAQLAEQRTGTDSQDADAWLQLGIARQRLGQYSKAIEALERARELEPGRAETLYQLGRTYAFAERWQDALNVLNAAIERDSGLAYAYYYRGLTANRLGNKERTINDLDRFVTLAPKAPEAERARRIVRAAGR